MRLLIVPELVVSGTHCILGTDDITNRYSS